VRFRISDKRYVFTTRRLLQACGIVMLWTFGPVSETLAQTVDSQWKTETRFYLSGLSYYWANDNTSASYDTLAATGELRFKAEGRPWYASLFADYRYSTDRLYTDKWNIGGLIKYGRYSWDATAYAFLNKSPETPDTWLYAGRIRYRLAEDHKIGIEAIASFRNTDAPQLMLGYYGDIKDTLSLTVAAGRSTGDGPDLSARLELIWRVF
jgi:hypothetical protein